MKDAGWETGLAARRNSLLRETATLAGHMIGGFATGPGTRRYTERFPSQHAAGHFRPSPHPDPADSLLLSSIGIGTYLGESDESTDHSYQVALLAALRGGINVIDTAINYRHQRSERCIGRALAAMIDRGELSRDEVVVCTKAGYLSFDGTVPADPRAYFVREYIETGVLDPKEVAAGSHCMAPRFLKDQIARSRANLGLECIDVFYLHNPETQLGDVPPGRFVARLRSAFEFLEQQVHEGRIRSYGIATWNAFRVAPDEPSYMSLEACVETARAISRSHHFRYIQLPFNLAMTEGHAAKNQSVAGKWTSVFDAARRLSLTVIGSSTLMQARLADDLPDRVRQTIAMNGDAEAAIQFARSAPGVTTSLVGMGSSEHVARNVQLGAVPAMDASAWLALFQ